MLDGAFTTPKIRRLAAILEVPWPHAIGLCGLLWRFTAKHASNGEIGRHDDEEIAAALEWPGDETALVAALVRCRLLDLVDGPARLIVHDWPHHAPRYVLSKLKRTNGDYSPHYERTTDASAVDGAVDNAPLTTSSPTSTFTPTPTKRGATNDGLDERIEAKSPGGLTTSVCSGDCSTSGSRRMSRSKRFGSLPSTTSTPSNRRRVFRLIRIV